MLYLTDLFIQYNNTNTQYLDILWVFHKQSVKIPVVRKINVKGISYMCVKHQLIWQLDVCKASVDLTSSITLYGQWKNAHVDISVQDALKTNWWLTVDDWPIEDNSAQDALKTNWWLTVDDWPIEDNSLQLKLISEHSWKSKLFSQTLSHYCLGNCSSVGTEHKEDIGMKHVFRHVWSWSNVCA